MFCYNCGKELERNQKNCPDCHTAVPENRENRKASIVVTEPSTVAEEKKVSVPSPKRHGAMVCPQCGAEDLQVINEVDTQISGKGFSGSQACCGWMCFGPLGLLCGNCGSGQTATTTNKLYFVCPKCGKKFRKPSDLRDEAAKVRKGGIGMLVGGIIGAILDTIIISSIADGDPSFTSFGVFMGFFMAIVGIVSCVSNMNRATALEGEAAEIERSMKSHR